MKDYRWGRLVESSEKNGAWAERLCAEAQSRRAACAARPAWATLSVLEKTGRLWADPNGSYRRRAQRILERTGAFSSKTIFDTLELLPQILNRRALRARLVAELGRADAMERWSMEPAAEFSERAVPLGTVLTVAAGNIFLGCIDAVVMSLVTNNVAILKTSASDREFPLLFADSLRRADPERIVSSTLAVVSWKSGTESVERTFKNRLQGISVWGGEGAILSYRKDLPITCRLLEFGPKLSFAVVTKAGLKRLGVSETARRIARDASRWDQSACASPQTLFIEGNSDDLLMALGQELESLSKQSPKGPTGPEDAVATLEGRHRALAAELLDQGRLIESPKDQHWTVAQRSEPGLRASPLGRFVQVSPFRGLDHLTRLISPAGGHLQSAGLAVGANETSDYARTLGEIGVTRVSELGGMLDAEAGEPHDGRRPLAELVRVVSAPASVHSAPDDGALRSLLGQARAESPFYRKRLKSLDLSRAVPLTKHDLYAHTPPKSRALLTGDAAGLVFASGGSTGKPKFSLFSQEDFDETCRWLAYGMRRAGLEEGDTVANLFVAGNLWSSFVAVSRALRHLPVVQLPIGGTTAPADALDALVRFRATAAIGLPSTLLELARLAREKKVRGLAVRKIFYAGEGLSAAAAAELRRGLGAKLIRSAGYASVDAGLIGWQCRECGPGEHHAAGLQRMEIVDGEILATNLARRWMPIVRYRTGDRGKWLGPCPCGDPSPRFLLMGRCDDRINAGGAHFDLGDAARAVAAVKGLGPQFSVVVSANGSRDALTVRVERRGRASGDAALAAALSKALRARSLELDDSIARGWLSPPTIEFVAPGSLPRHPRTGKTRAVVDLRR